ncbi:patatin [Prosthecochloris sp. ZM_2]|uniref:patatin-like phospholipase family protein n=1 Tax=Prosthecochloris sp. ZM_2 TaxID=2045206 RepID=UPI000DF7A023|nr:patatin-like phospholipase family protein [Prosthecochloris sp. ZM_2]RNA65439.1 patatin [Prosthecochloris sp. ZM_2]
MRVTGEHRDRSVGLALGGGAVLGAAHVGVLRALDECGISVRAVAGTSIGAFIAALHAFGKSWQEIADVARDLDWFDLSGLSLSQYGLLSNKKMGGIIRDLLGRQVIEHAGIALSLVATDIATGGKVVMEQGDVSSAVMASACIPGVFRPVERNGLLLVDGVLVENVPLSPLQQRETLPVVCVDLMGGHEFSRPDNIVGLLLNAFYSALHNTTALQLESADLVITPDIGRFSLVDTSKVPEIIEAGYRSALPVLRDFSVSRMR